MRKLLRLILVSFFMTLTFGFVEGTAIASSTPEQAATDIVDVITTEALTPSVHEETSTHETTAHEGPHIPAPKGKIIEGWSIGGLPITNTIFSTWIFMGVLFVLVAFMYIAIATDKLPRLRAFGLDIVNRIYMYARSLVGMTQSQRTISGFSEDSSLSYFSGISSAWCSTGSHSYQKMSGSETISALYILISLRHSYSLSQ